MPRATAAKGKGKGKAAAKGKGKTAKSKGKGKTAPKSKGKGKAAALSDAVPRPEGAPDNYIGVGSPAFDQLHARAAVPCMAAQKLLAEWLEERDSSWAAELDDGTFTLGGITFKADLVGTTSPTSFIWADARQHPSGFSPRICAMAKAVRKWLKNHGVPEAALKDGRLAFADDQDSGLYGHYIAQITAYVARVLDDEKDMGGHVIPYAYYSGPVGPGSATWFVIRARKDGADLDPEINGCNKTPATMAIQLAFALPPVLAGGFLPHADFRAAWLDVLGSMDAVAIENEGDEIKATASHGDERVQLPTLTFDRLGRVSSISSTILPA